MKIFKHICVFIFLLGMVFTIVQYIPLGEELVTKTELAKKAGCEEDSEGDSDEDGDEKAGEFTTSFVSLDWSNFRVNQHLRNYYQHKYRCALINIITPPPEV